jgi:hypothetical protein
MQEYDFIYLVSLHEFFSECHKNLVCGLENLLNCK